MSERSREPKHLTLLDDRVGADQPRPAVDVRVVLFTLTQGELLVAVHRYPAGLGLPRDVPMQGESLDVAARRIVRESTMIQEQYLEQLYTLSVTESANQWSIIIGYIALVCSEPNPIATEHVIWRSTSRLGELSETDRMVVAYAVLRLRAKLGYTNIAFHLLPETFTLTELQNAYETILGQRLDKRNFRRRMIASRILDETENKRRDGSHRPAALYRFRADLDTAAYLTPPWSKPAEGAAST
jgi:8-oxo-dGTP diphosphatase